MESMSLETILTHVQSLLSKSQIASYVSEQPSVKTGSAGGSLRSILPPVLPKNVAPLPLSQTTLPEDSSTLQLTIDSLHAHILPYLNLSSLSPNYYGFVTGGSTPAALLADFLVSIYDQNCSVHLPREAITTEVEAATLKMLRELLHFDETEWGGTGTLTTGATASNILGLAIGREYVLAKALQKRQAEKNGSVQQPSDMADIEVAQGTGDIGIAEAVHLAGVRKIQVLSTEPHSSITKAASIVGIGRFNVVSIAMDGDPLKIDLGKLEQEARKAFAGDVDSDGSGQGRVLSILTISAGEVNTGGFATDLSLMQKIRRICDTYDVWLHVDGAFGIFGRLLPIDSELQSQQRPIQIHDQDLSSSRFQDQYSTTWQTDYTYITSSVSGLELADSITGDAHKLLNVPYDCGFFLLRRKHRSLSEAVFRNGNAAYLAAPVSMTPEPTSSTTTTTTGGTAEQASLTASFNDIPSPLNIGLENSRRFRALPIWTNLMTYGRKGYEQMLIRQITLARMAAEYISTSKTYELLPRHWFPATSSKIDSTEGLRKIYMIVLFRAVDDRLNDGLVKRINDSGKIYVTGTVWQGEKACRIAVSNWRANPHVDFGVIRDVLEAVGKDWAGEMDISK